MNQAVRTVLIVDDEAPARQRLERLVDELPAWVCIGSCANGTEALRHAEQMQPDAVLLDIRMPGMGGIEVARHLARLHKPPAIIFATAYDQYALEAFDTRAIGYLLKPVRRERLAGALEQAARLTEGLLRDLSDNAPGAGPRRNIAVRERGVLKLIPLTDVRYFLAEQKYVSVFHAHGENLIEESLRQLEDEFADRFVRVHRSALVAIDAIELLEKDQEGAYLIRLRGTGTVLPVSRRQLHGLKERLTSGR